MKIPFIMANQNSKYNILIVDDEHDVHVVLGKMLQKSGYLVQSAYNAEDALNKIKETKPDLIMLDIMMPKISGIELCNNIKNDPSTKNIIVVIISAKDEQSDRIDGLTHGADDYISKPFHLRSLVRKIDRILQKRDEDQVTNLTE
ncbi:MAG: response regulator receiver protein [Deltaproteobacteria bacterium CG07_land_8_20_14_0_80_38_7]|nr:MAG: response regulator receiver protein [Deltaproteobacteria bacterium CG07_land_8_20_14_0_80_38_7]